MADPMSHDDSDLRIRPGRIRDGGRRTTKARTFVGQVMRAARKAGHTGKGFGRSAGGKSSRFGRGRAAALALTLRAPSRRVLIKARVVRQLGTQFRQAPLARHLAYLKRDGVTRDGVDASMFDARADRTDERAFADRCSDDRHHFRFIISPEGAGELADLRAFTRELMVDVERDLGTRLDWVAVDHWNTDNPHLHVLVRGRADDGPDLVISRDYISRGFRSRAEERVTLELGPRTEQQIRNAFKRDVEAERWTGLDRALRAAADEAAGLADLRPGGADNDPELRRLMIGRASKLQRLGLAEQVSPGRWNLKPDLDQTLRQLSARGDIIETMHRAMTQAGREADVSRFVVHGETPLDPVVGRLIERGLQDELKASAYAVIEGVDGRTHHLGFADLDLTGDARVGAIVETRSHRDANGAQRLSLEVRSDLTLQEQITARGATWIDRQLLAPEPLVCGGSFGAGLRAAMERRIDHLAQDGLARRQVQRVVFARGLLETLRRRELDDAIRKIGADHGLSHRPSVEGEQVAGSYRQRLMLSSGRFAMIDDGSGFQLVPWRPALERHLGKHVSGVMLPGGRIDWHFDRTRGLGR
jgi:type IV secretory pathway VirD2 relaxase